MTEDYLLAARAAVELVGRVEVMQRWDQPSALAQMSVGAVAAHLASQVLSVHGAVTAGKGVTTEQPVLLLEHYERVRWVRADLHDEANVTIRERAASAAADGHGTLVASVQQALADVGTAFAAGQLPPAIRMPQWDWSVSFDDFLVTRMMEIAVHADDLAVSVDVDPPELPESVLGPVLALLVGISLRRHGQAAVVRTLARRERAPGSIAAF
jgi:hypothetical protein